MMNIATDLLFASKPARPGVAVAAIGAPFTLPEVAGTDAAVAVTSPLQDETSPDLQNDAAFGSLLPAPDASLLSFPISPLTTSLGTAQPASMPVIEVEQRTVATLPAMSLRPATALVEPGFPVPAAFSNTAATGGSQPMFVASEPPQGMTPAAVSTTPVQRDLATAPALPLPALPVKTVEPERRQAASATLPIGLGTPALRADRAPVDVPSPHPATHAVPVRVGADVSAPTIGPIAQAPVVPMAAASASPPVRALPPPAQQPSIVISSTAPPNQHAPKAEPLAVALPLGTHAVTGERLTLAVANTMVPPSPTVPDEPATAIPMPRHWQLAAVQPQPNAPAAPAHSAAMVAPAAFVAGPSDRRAEQMITSTLSTAALTPLSTAFAPIAETPMLDLGREGWPTDMMAHIEQLRDAVDATDTRIRLVPDMLGSVDIDVRQDGDTLHVRFSAEQAQTRTLLQDAQPRLAEAAEARGLKLGGSSVDAGAQGQHRQPAAQPAVASKRTSSTVASGQNPADDARIA